MSCPFAKKGGYYRAQTQELFSPLDVGPWTPPDFRVGGIRVMGQYVMIVKSCNQYRDQRSRIYKGILTFKKQTMCN